MEIKIPKNFFGEDIPLTVFISEEQLKAQKCGKVFGTCGKRRPSWRCLTCGQYA